MTKQKKRRAPRSKAVRCKDVIKEAMKRLGGSVQLADLYESIARHPKVATNPTWRATTRRTLQQSPEFEHVARGRWRLK